MNADPAADTAGSDSIGVFWARFAAHAQVDAAVPQPPAWGFGDSPELADKLLALVLHGPKRATAGIVADYEADSEALPEVGDYSIILDGANQPRAVIQTTDVRVGPLASVDDQFAWDEGEGDRSRAWWLEAHARFLRRRVLALGIEFSMDIETVFERFDLIYSEAS